MTILIDHCVPLFVARWLDEWGYPVTLLKEHIPVDSPDSDVIELAQDLDAVLLTADKDFSSILDYPPDSHVGIIVLRHQLADDDLADSLQQVISELYRDGLRQTLVVVNQRGYRIRRSSP